ncbi:MAG: heparinase II/III-family protein, partial [Phycisphaerae bacterium]|nr:heparinase II/III-family protein [Phycisphaerae bacterium]
LVIADAIETNDAYRSRAVEELLNLIHWSTWVDPCHPKLHVDLCTAEAAVAAIVGLDWLWDSLEETQRQQILEVLDKRVLQAYRQSVEEKVWWATAVNHWGAVIHAACGMVGVAMRDKNPHAKEVYRLSRAGLQHFFNDLGKEGGWDEGLGHWGYAMRYVLLFGEACARLEDDQKVLHHRGMDETGLFPIYFSPNGHPASFGDTSPMPLHGTLYLLDKYFDRPEITWWLDTYCLNHDVNTTDWSRAGLALLFRQPGESVAPQLEPVKAFNQIGWVAMADAWPQPGFYAAIKTGDLATNHAQRDMNSLQLQVDGEMLLVDPGNLSGETNGSGSDARSEFYEIQARAHNTITVAEEDHRPDAQGSIRHIQTGKNFHWAVCDGGEAAGENVRFLRHVVMLPQAEHQMLVVLDELNLGAPERVDMFWHAGGQIELDADTMTGRITGRHAELHFGLASTALASASKGKYSFNGRWVDRFLHLSAGMIGQNYFCSVFSREAIPSKLQIEPNEQGSLTLRIGKIVIVFQPGTRHLELDDIKSD